MSDYRFGKLPYKHDKRTFLLEKYVDLKGLAPAPLSFDLSADPNFPKDLHMFKNDTYGCCTIAAIAHLIMMEAMRMGKTVSISDAVIIKDYFTIGRAENPG
jgi:hypothetical protein